MPWLYLTSWRGWPMGGKLYVVGVGPGGPEHRTQAAERAIRDSDLVVGYETYLSLIEDLTAGKDVRRYKMKEEVKRAEVAIEEAAAGRRVAVVSGGDPQVYGMAPLVLEILARRGAYVEVEVVPGVTAALAAAALLGAPLGDDFAVVNLSDLLTPRAVIFKRVEAAALGDFVIAMYNPIDKSILAHALDVVKKVRGPDVPVGVVKNAYRPGQWVWTGRLAEAPVDLVDMRTTIIVGRRDAILWRGFMVTPRGYSNKYRL